ncbi:MAG: carbon storage regulator CsrA [Spirochaetes bacterium]|nr:carbon storage regulator CsrA [Spirochaetota bacterium]
MLVLARKINQSIILNDDIEVMVLDVQGEQVKLGIKAPKSVKIFRKEVYESIQKENIEALKSQTHPIDDLTKLLKDKKKKN